MALSSGGAKSVSMETIPMTKGGAADARGKDTVDNDEPGSSRVYPKGGAKPATTDNAPFNPQKVPAGDRYVGGV